MDEAAKYPARKQPAHQVIISTCRPTMVFLTVCTQGRRPVLANAVTHDLLCDVWNAATAWRVGRYVVMPDHIHLFIGPGSPELPLTNWVSFWKRSFTKRHGKSVWQQNHWDTTLRSADHAADRWEYIRQNPVRARLVATADEWPWQGELKTLAWS